MALNPTKPTSPGRRFTVQVKSPELHKGEPHGPLVSKKTRSGGRNNAGRISVRHRGGGHKRRYREVDFRRQNSLGLERKQCFVLHHKGRKRCFAECPTENLRDSFAMRLFAAVEDRLDKLPRPL